MPEFKKLLFQRITDIKIIGLTVAANVALLSTYNQKSVLLVVIAYGICLLMFTKKSLMEIVFLTTLFVLPFEYGLRSWFVPVITPSVPDDAWSIYRFYFGLSIKLIGSLALFIICLIKLIKKGVYWPKWPVVLLLIWILAIVLSSFGATNQDIAWLFVARISVPISLFIASSYLFTQSGKNLVGSILDVVSGTALIQGLVGIYQFFSGHLAGLYLEESASPYGFWTSDGASQFRASGLLGHPTFYGSLMSMLLPLWLWLVLYFGWNQQSFRRKYYALILVVVGLGIAVSLSRSAWIVAVGVIIYVYGQNKNLMANYKNTISLFLFGLISILFGPAIYERLKSFLIFFSEQGTSASRISLMAAAVKMMFANPLLGVGPNHFTAALYEVGLDEKTRYFIFPVHNVPLLLMAEIGLIGSLALFIFVGIVLYRSYQNKSWKYFGGMWLAAIAYILNAQVHPLLNQDPTFDYFMLFLGILYASSANFGNSQQK